jgi:hypothetical protein
VIITKFVGFGTGGSPSRMAEHGSNSVRVYKSGSRISEDGSKLIIRIYQGLKNEKVKLGCDGLKHGVATLLGISSHTMKLIVDQYEKYHTFYSSTFHKPGDLKMSRSTFDVEQMKYLITTFIIGRSMVGKSTFVQDVKDELLNYEIEASETTLRGLLHRWGWGYAKWENKSGLRRLQHIIDMRSEYLCNAVQNRKGTVRTNYVEVFVDECGFYEHDHWDFTWQDLARPVMYPRSGRKGRRWVTFGAMTKEKLLNGSSFFLYNPKATEGDYKDFIDTPMYLQYLKEKLIPELGSLGSGGVAARCVLIMDRAPYHTQKFAPNESPLNMVKRKMLDWLKVNCPKETGYNSFTKMNVLKIIVRKELAKIPTTVERFLEGYGHKVFYLPPAHPRLNPIESVWAQMKAHVRKMNDVNMTFKKMEALIWDTGMNVVKNVNVVNYYHHTLKVEDHYRKDDEMFLEMNGTVNNIPYDASHVEEWDSKEDKEEDEEEIGTSNRRSKRLKTR